MSNYGKQAEPLSRVLLILPTRGRFWQAMECVASVMKHSSGLCDIVLCTDPDDHIDLHYITGNSHVWTCDQFFEGILTNAPVCRRSFVEWVNFAALNVGKGHERVGWLGDDVRFLTPGWDKKILGHKELIVYGPDGSQNETLCTHPFVHISLVQAMGYMIHPALKHYFADNFLMELGTALDSIRFTKDVEISHHRPGGDATYIEAEEAWGQHDKDAWKDMVQPSIPAMVKRIQKEL